MDRLAAVALEDVLLGFQHTFRLRLCVSVWWQKLLVVVAKIKRLWFALCVCFLTGTKNVLFLSSYLVLPSLEQKRWPICYDHSYEQPNFDNEMQGTGKVLLSAFWLSLPSLRDCGLYFVFPF